VTEREALKAAKKKEREERKSHKEAEVVRKKALREAKKVEQQKRKYDLAELKAAKRAAKNARCDPVEYTRETSVVEADYWTAVDALLNLGAGVAPAPNNPHAV